METNQVKNHLKAVADLTKPQVILELSTCEFMTLYALLTDATSRQSPQYDMYEKLLHNIMVSVFKKFFSQGAEVKNSYSIELSSVECLAFWLYWTDHSYSTATIAGKILDRINTFILLMFTPDPYKN